MHLQVLFAESMLNCASILYKYPVIIGVRVLKTDMLDHIAGNALIH